MTQGTFPFEHPVIKTATFSDCRNYRYALWRMWDVSLAYLTFIGLNPSTANENTDDPTIKRVVQIARNLGYGGVCMLNLFAIVSPYPEILKTHPDPVGPENDYWLKKLAVEDIVFAWGNFKEATGRAEEVMRMFPKAMALHINKNGTPKHPLYCRADSKPVNFDYVHKNIS